MATLKDIESHLKQGETAKALLLAKSKARRKPKDPATLDVLARSYAASGEQRLALATYSRIAILLPNHAKPLADKAHLMQEMGDLDAAEAHLRKALALAKLDGVLLRMLSVTTKLSPDDAIVVRFQAAWHANQLSPKDRMHAGFALGAILSDNRFHYIDEANRLQRAANPWSILDRRKEVRLLQAALSSGDWTRQDHGTCEKRPIFITGMPRSGTTLVEQILTCHADVGTTGETGLSLRAAYSVIAGKDAFRSVSDLSSEDVKLIGNRYLQGIDLFHNPPNIFTDKTIQTYMVMGLMQQALSNARFIVVRRDPRDIGLSIYRNYFESGTHGYSNCLEDIAHYISTMEDMLEFWKKEFPASFIEVEYEDLVTDPEPVIRRILDYCSLPWDAACLSPEKSTASVKTLSVAQVRSPISPKSVGGWRQHKEELSPLIAALKDESPHGTT